MVSPTQMQCDYETLRLNKIPVTIRQCAEYTLSLPMVEEALCKFYAYQRTVDRLIDTLVGMHDTDMLPIKLYDKEDESIFAEIPKDMETLKETALERIMLPLVKNFTKKRYQTELAQHDQIVSTRDYAVIRWVQQSMDLYKEKPCSELLRKYHLVLFRQFTLTRVFQKYILNCEIPFLKKGGAGCTQREELSQVFCLFLWMTLHDSEHISIELGYHPNYQVVTSKTTSLAEEEIMSRAMMAGNRHRLLLKHKDEIRLDGTGTIRLSFDDMVWGGVTIDNETTCRVVNKSLFSLLKGPRVEPIPKICTHCAKLLSLSWYFTLDGRDLNSPPFCGFRCMEEYTPVK